MIPICYLMFTADISCSEHKLVVMFLLYVQFLMTKTLGTKFLPICMFLMDVNKL